MLLWDDAEDAREGEALWDRDMEAFGTRRSTRSAVASETKVGTDVATGCCGESKDFVAVDGAALETRLEVFAADCMAIERAASDANVEVEGPKRDELVLLALL